MTYLAKRLATQLLGLSTGALIGALPELVNPDMAPYSMVWVNAWLGQILSGSLESRKQGGQGCRAGCLAPMGALFLTAVLGKLMLALGMSETLAANALGILLCGATAALFMGIDGPPGGSDPG